MTTNHDKPWMIYGAYGFTGALIARAAAQRNLRPVLAGRSADKLAPLAENLGLGSRAFPLDTVDGIAGNLEGVSLVLNCAGPFNPSADRLVQACIQRGVHYLDICGEPDMFERHIAHHQQAADADTVILPGVGFDVVPSDILANKLAGRMPNAVNLEMAFFGDGSGSAGSAKTSLCMFADKCKVRRNGKIVRKPLAFSRRSIRFSDRTEWCMSVSWGDISTAYRSTRIPNITMYMAINPKAARILRILSPVSFLLAAPAIQRKLFSRIEQSIKGPDADTRSKTCMRLWGCVSDAQGNTLEATVDTPEGFTFTTEAALACVNKVLEGKLAGGFYTPAQAFGTEWIADIPNVVFNWRNGGAC